jgi:hypothetical protein
MNSRKKILKLRCFSPLKILTSLFYLQRLLELFFFLPLFFNNFFSPSFFQCSVSLRTWGFDDKRGEKHSSKISFQMK